ncbi:MAG: type II secretion system minor pseudopilin GspI [Gammaproteobacteria bacterium]|nr:type II secretion system minor pseudopilin GspI [Gammaproteobacteria bacterium]
MRGARGFTLVEVLVALVIVAVGMAAVMSALTSSADVLQSLRERTFAQWVALNRIATVRLNAQMPATGDTEADVDFANRRWHYRQQVVGTQVPGTVRIDVSVRPAEVKADAEHNWTTTVSGIYGNAVAPPSGVEPDWGSQDTPLNPNGGTGANGGPGTGGVNGPQLTTTPGTTTPGTTTPGTTSPAPLPTPGNPSNPGSQP